MNCTKCGTEINEASKFCSKCGAPTGTKKRHTLLWIGLVILTLLVIGRISEFSQTRTGGTGVPTTAAPQCTPSDIKVDKLRATDIGYGYTRITGRLTNGCAEPVGPQVKITSYDRSGNILSVHDIWPASVSNIPAHSEFPFEWQDNVAGFDHFTISVIDVKRWQVDH